MDNECVVLQLVALLVLASMILQVNPSQFYNEFEVCVGYQYGNSEAFGYWLLCRVTTMSWQSPNTSQYYHTM